MTWVWVSEVASCLMARVPPVGQVELDVPYDNWSCHFYLLRACLQQEGTAVWGTGWLSQSCASCCHWRGVNEGSIEGREWGSRCAGQGCSLHAALPAACRAALQQCSSAARSQGLHRGTGSPWQHCQPLPLCWGLHCWHSVPQAEQVFQVSSFVILV